jgi:hypothetical protein
LPRINIGIAIAFAEDQLVANDDGDNGAGNVLRCVAGLL